MFINIHLVQYKVKYINLIMFMFGSLMNNLDEFRLLLLLAKLNSNIKKEDFDRLESALSPVVHVGQDQVDIALS